MVKDVHDLVLKTFYSSRVFMVQNEIQTYPYVTFDQASFNKKRKGWFTSLKSQFYTFVSVRTANLPDDLGGRFDNLTLAQKIRVGKFYFRSAPSSDFVIDA